MAKTVVKKKEVKQSLWRSSKRFRSLVLWVFEILAAIALAAIFTAAFCYSVPVQDSSMAPTVAAGDKVLVNRAAFRFGRPGRYDVIAYRPSNSLDTTVRIKRVIGMPGDKILIRDGLIIINDETYIEDREFPSMVNPGLAAEPIKLGENEYFVLGDNRNDSQDSRFADVGNLTRNDIIGKVWFRLPAEEHVSFVH